MNFGNFQGGLEVDEQGEDCSGKFNSPEIATPSRKVSSSRLMNAFSQLYGSSNPATPPLIDEEREKPTSRAMESKLMSMWHNVKYGWSGKMRSSFSKEQPVWLLGRCYHRKFTPPSSMENSVEFSSSSLGSRNNFVGPEECIVVQELGTDVVENVSSENPWEEGIEGFKKDFYSRLWLTYRREFPILNGSNYTSDCGWGCMLRSGQMLLAQGLICHFLGRSWRWDSETQLHSTIEDNTHRKIIRYFGDSSSKKNPFSIHTLVNLGQESGKKPGDWYGPSSVSYLLRQAVIQAKQENADFDNLVVYVAKDCTIYIQDVLDECLIPEPPVLPWQTTSNNKSTINTQLHWKAVIILVPLRLGTEKLNPIYAHCLTLLLSNENCLGIIGGRPKHSLYFVGYQEDKLIHLDPHFCQEVVDVNQENFQAYSFHCKSPRKLKATKMDPSCCVGFYCHTKADFDKFIMNVQPFLHPMRFYQSNDKQNESSPMPNSDINYPMFVFSRGRNTDEQKNEPTESVYKPLQLQLAQIRQELCTTDDETDETEEFVIL